jgi:pyruvate dehydrogenase E1 component alpha subunit
MSPENWIYGFELMMLIRRFEEQCGKLYRMGKITGFCHLYIGQEAVAVGAFLSKRSGDTMVTAYRDHGHALLCGLEPKYILAELMGKATGSSKGKGGSMHIFNPQENFFGGHGIVGSSVPIGTGLAFAEKYKSSNNISYTFLGDGAANQGQVFESFNMAKLWSLPVIYIIENNGYSMGTSVQRSTYMQDLSCRGLSLGIDGVQVNGMELDTLYNMFCYKAEKVRECNEPSIIEVKTYRFRGHSMSDPGNYRSRDEVDQYRKGRDPISYARQKILEYCYASELELKTIENKVATQINDAVAFSESSSLPDADELYTDVQKKS